MVTGKSKVDKELCTLVDYYNEQLRLLNKHKTPRISQDIRDRPFNLKGGGYGFLFRSEIFFSDNTRVRIFIFLSRKAQIFFPEFNIRLYDKISETDYFFPPPKSEYFVQQHWESEYFFRKKPYPLPSS